MFGDRERALAGGVMNVVRWGKWGLALFALDRVAWIIYLALAVAAVVLAVAIVADRVQKARAYAVYAAEEQRLAELWASQ